jgi:hypothetical protein
MCCAAGPRAIEVTGRAVLLLEVMQKALAKRSERGCKSAAQNSRFARKGQLAGIVLSTRTMIRNDRSFADVCMLLCRLALGRIVIQS